MTSTSSSSELKISLIDPFTIGTGHSMIRISYGGADFLDLTLYRKFRVPEDGKKYNNTASNGLLPVYSVEQFRSKLLADTAKAGGLAVPIFNREAVSLHFKSSRPYAIKMFVGDNNAISGEPKVETSTTAIRRKHRLTVGEPIQDYYIAGEPWFDGFRTLTGNCKQFVSGTPTLQIQIMPTKRVVMCVLVKMFAEEIVSTFSVEGLEATAKVRDLKEKIFLLKKVGVKEQKLVLVGKQLEDDASLHEYEIRDGSTISLLVKKDPGDSDSGSINGSDASSIDREEILHKKLSKVKFQDWDKENTITFNINLINATVFESLLGIKTRTPLTMIMYKVAGIPFVRDIYNEVKVASATALPSASLSEGGIEPVDTATTVGLVDTVALSKANKKLSSIPITQDSTSVMPEFLLECEMVARIRAMNPEERVAGVGSHGRGSTSSAASSFAGHSFRENGKRKRTFSSASSAPEPFPEI